MNSVKSMKRIMTLMLMLSFLLVACGAEEANNQSSEKNPNSSFVETEDMDRFDNVSDQATSKETGEYIFVPESGVEYGTAVTEGKIKLEMTVNDSEFNPMLEVNIHLNMNGGYLALKTDGEGVFSVENVDLNKAHELVIASPDNQTIYFTGTVLFELANECYSNQYATDMRFCISPDVSTLKVSVSVEDGFMSSLQFSYE